MNPKPPEGTIGDRIRGLLSDRGISQRQLAVMLAGAGAPREKVENLRRQISSWVNDEHAPSPDNAARIADALDVPAAWFIDGQQPRKSLAAALEELAGLADAIGERAETERQRSEEAVAIVLDLDHRLSRIEEALGRLLEGQLRWAQAFESGELGRRDDAGQSEPPARQPGSN